MNFEKMRFSKEHEWVAFEDDSDIVSIGITEYAAGELGDIVYVELPEVGREVQFLESIGTIEAVKTVADLYSPVSGVVRELNAELEASPELVNQSPYEEGWFLKMELRKRTELDQLMTHDEYNEMIGEE